MSLAQRVSFHTLGCRLNQAETALIAERFRERGYSVVEHGAHVNIAVINTCSVTEHADSRCRQEIRKVRRLNPDAIVCAVGCYSQADPEKVAAIAGVDVVVGNDKKYQLAEIIENWRERDGGSLWVSRRVDTGDFDYPMAGYYPHQTRANIKVQDGCDFCCAFCILPRIRGQARSRPPVDIFAEGEALAERGHKEVVITGVNVGTYRFSDVTLADLVWQLSEIPGIERIRISSIEPSTVSDRLLDWIASSPKACHHLHLPLQSGDDATLAAMKRVYTTSEYAQFVERAMKAIPDLGLGTDIMVGFPGETDRRFTNSVKFVEAMPFSYLHVFSYSDRPRTASNAHTDKCLPPVIQSRSGAMHALAERKKRAFFDRSIGRREMVLFESVDADGYRKGYTGSYIRVGVKAGTSENALLSTQLVSARSDFCVGQVSMN